MDHKEELSSAADELQSSSAEEEATVTQKTPITENAEPKIEVPYTESNEDAFAEQFQTTESPFVSTSQIPPAFLPTEESPAANEADDEEDEERFAVNAHYFVEVFTLTLCVILFLTTFLTRHTVVDGGSMDNTLQDGQHLLISDLFYTPKRGDIVVLQSPETDDIKAPIVKRIIALEGDTVRIEAGVVYVNGEPLDEPYVKRGCHLEQHFDFPEHTVEEGHVFVLGDHRDNSYDSRYFNDIDKRCILGRAYLRIFPFADFGLIN